MSAVAQGAARSVVTQGIGVATGLQQSFDWKGVAASAIASGVGFEGGRAIGSSVSGMDPTVGRLITGVGAGMAAGAASTVVRGGSLGRNVGAITMDAMASTVGSLVVDNVQAASLGKTDSAALRTQQAIAGVNEQILPVGLGSGFVAPETPYSGNAALHGPYGGLVDSSQAPYSAASTLYGPTAGFSTVGPLSQGPRFAYSSRVNGTNEALRPIGLAGGDGDALLYAWNAQKRPATDVRGGFDQLGRSTTGRAQYDLGRTWVADVPKLPVNLALNAVEGSVNLLGGALPGAPDYVPFLSNAKIPYNSEASSYAEFGLGLLLGRSAGASGAKDARVPTTTVTTYRIEGAPNKRIEIGESGRVSLVPDKDSVIWLNFGQTGRATLYYHTKVEKGLPEATFKSFEVESRFVDKVRVDAVPERFSRQYPDKPIISRDPYPDQFGLPKAYFDELMKSIVQGTGRNGR
ncbi:hypothetical protein GR165_36325 [Burkholderia sp. 4812]|nr:hypothetical protein [Burkholderia sp. 4812]